MPTGGELHQADGTSWMAFYCLYMLKIAVELALKVTRFPINIFLLTSWQSCCEVDPVYEDMASKFFEHFVLISDAMNALTEGKQGLWDSKDGFFYDSLKIDGHNIPLKVRPPRQPPRLFSFCSPFLRCALWWASRRSSPLERCPTRP